MQLSVIKYEAIPITDDDDMEIIFSTISFHPCLSSAEFYLNMQSLEDVGDIHDRVNFEVDRDLGMTTQVEEQNVCLSPYIIDNIASNMDSRHTEE